MKNIKNLFKKAHNPESNSDNSDKKISKISRRGFLLILATGGFTAAVGTSLLKSSHSNVTTLPPKQNFSVLPNTSEQTNLSFLEKVRKFNKSLSLPQAPGLEFGKAPENIFKTPEERNSVSVKGGVLFPGLLKRDENDKYTDPQILDFLEKSNQRTLNFYQKTFWDEINSWQSFYEKNDKIVVKSNVYFTKIGKFWVQNQPGQKVTQVYFENPQGEVKTIADPQNPKFQIENLDLKENYLVYYLLSEDNSKMVVSIDNAKLGEESYNFVIDLASLKVISVVKAIKFSTHFDHSNPNLLFYVKIENGIRKLYQRNLIDSSADKLISQGNEKFVYVSMNTRKSNDNYYLTRSSFGNAEVTAINKKTGQKQIIYQSLEGGNATIAIEETPEQILYFITNQKYPFGKILAVLKTVNLSESTFEKAKSMPEKIQGSFNNKLSSVATSPSGLIIAKYTSLPFDKVKIFTKNGELIKELDLPSGNYEVSWEDDTNKLVVKVISFDKPTTTYSIDADNSDYEAKVLNIELLPENVKKVQTTAELSHAPFLNGENVTIEGQKIKGVPMVFVSDPTIKNENILNVDLNVYAGFGINHLTAENIPLSSLAKIIQSRTALILGGPRGGVEYGERWGKINLNREESYRDVLALLTQISQNYPNAQISLTGGSNGGLTVMGSFLYGLLNNQNGQYDQALKKLNRILIRNSVTDLSSLLYTFNPEVSLAWQVAEDGNPNDPKQWQEIEKASPMHMLQKIIQMKDGTEKQKIMLGLQKVFILVTTNVQDRTVDPSQSTRLLAALNLISKNSFGYFPDGDHSGAFVTREEEANLEYTLYWTTLTVK